MRIISLLLPLCLALVGCASTITDNRDDKFLNDLRAKFIHSLATLPTSSPKEAAEHLRSTLSLSDKEPQDNLYASLEIRKGGRSLVSVLVGKPFGGANDPNPNSFYIGYGELLYPSHQIIDHMRSLLGPPVFKDSNSVYWRLDKGVLRLNPVTHAIDFTPFELRDLFDQIRIPNFPALYPPQDTAKFITRAVAIAGRGPDAYGSACIRTFDQDDFAVCAELGDSDNPRHVWLKYLGPPEFARSRGIPLLVAYGQSIGIAIAPDQLDVILASAIDNPSVIQVHKDGNFVVEAMAYPAGQYFIMRLDTCDRMGSVDRSIACYWQID